MANGLVVDHEAAYVGAVSGESSRSTKIEEQTCKTRPMTTRTITALGVPASDTSNVILNQGRGSSFPIFGL